MGTHSLVRHPDTPATGIYGVEVRWFEAGGQLILRYQVRGVDTLVLPPFAGKSRGDELWRTTCFELFLRHDDQRYVELNFSPSGRWAAYGFASYRAGRSAAHIAGPDVSGEAGQFTYMLTAKIDAAVLAGASGAGLSAIIEEQDGTLSYWALAHPPGQPDFHAPACFALPLGPGQRP